MASREEILFKHSGHRPAHACRAGRLGGPFPLPVRDPSLPLPLGGGPTVTFRSGPPDALPLEGEGRVEVAAAGGRPRPARAGGRPGRIVVPRSPPTLPSPSRGE